MSKLSKALQSASVSGTAGLNVEDIFSTYLYDGNSSTQTITNGIDLSGEGGLVWIKNRQLAYNNYLYDTERGVSKPLLSNLSDAEFTPTIPGLNQFNNNGFQVSDNGQGTDGGSHNYNNWNYASWSWRKARKFFDIQTWTGNGTAGRVIPHNLGSRPGMIITKCYSDSAPDWTVWHRNRNGTNTHLRLNEINAPQPGEDISAATDTTFTVGNDNRINGVSPRQYVAYIFAHNNGDGEFGPTADQDIIKCGSYAGTNSANFVDLGFEPEWVLIKNVTSNANWWVLDSMRGISVTGPDAYLRPAQNFVENESEIALLKPDGFELLGNHIESNLSTETYIYMAIRRGLMGRPESSADVFAVQPWDGSAAIPQFVSGFPVDFAIHKNKTANSEVFSSARLTQQRYMETSTSLLLSSDANFMFDYQNGYYDASTSANFVSWMWRRSPNFFDALFYRGDSVAGRQVPHNLGAVPEMIWVKRTDGAGNWWVYHKDQQASTVSGLQPPENSASRLDLDSIAVDGTNYWNDTLPSSTAFTVGNLSNTNGVGNDYMAYLFTSLAGISKCGGYVGNGTTLSIDCGFTAGTRFVIIKRTNTTGGWFVFDSLRGMSSGNDSTLELNDSAPEIINEDVIEATTTGFNVINSGSTVDTNDLNDRYIFYAIAN